MSELFAFSTCNLSDPHDSILLLDKKKKGSFIMTSLTLEQKIIKAAHLIADGKPVSFRGASFDTYMKVERLANRIKQEREFPQCPCGECD